MLYLEEISKQLPKITGLSKKTNNSIHPIRPFGLSHVAHKGSNGLHDLLLTFLEVTLRHVHLALEPIRQSFGRLMDTKSKVHGKAWHTLLSILPKYTKSDVQKSQGFCGMRKLWKMAVRRRIAVHHVYEKPLLSLCGSDVSVWQAWRDASGRAVHEIHHGLSPKAVEVPHRVIMMFVNV